MRKIIFFLVSIFLATSCLSLSVKFEGAKLRSGPGKNYKVKMDMQKHYPLRRIARKGKWYKVKDWQNQTGWMYESQLSSTKTAMVRKIKVNFRSGPGRGYRRLGKLYKGYMLRIIKKYGYWYKVEVIDPPNKQVGWIYRTLIWN